MNSRSKYRFTQLKTVFSIVLVFSVISCGSPGSDADSGPSSNLPDSVDANTLISYPADVEPLYDIELIREVDYGEVVEIGEEDEIFFGNLAVDDQGRLFGVGRERTIPVFQPDGTHITTLGRTGAGPGEFQADHPLEPKIQGDLLSVYDRGLQRIVFYSLESFEPIHHILMSPDNWMHIEELDGLVPNKDEFYPLNDSTFVIGFSGPTMSMDEIMNTRRGYAIQYDRTRYYNMNMEGQIVSEMLYERVTPMTMVNTNPDPGVMSIAPPIFYVMPFIARPKFTIDGDGKIYTTETDSLMITVREPGGEVLRTIHHPFERAAVDLESHIGTYTVRREIYESLNAPSTWPAINSFFVDDENRIWVATIIDDENLFEWWVLGERGELLARLPWDGRRDSEAYLGGIKTVKNGYLYTTEIIDEEFRTLQFVRYRIELTERGSTSPAP